MLDYFGQQWDANLFLDSISETTLPIKHEGEMLAYAVKKGNNG
jgi:hypothetical protein